MCASVPPQFIRAERLSHLQERAESGMLRRGTGGHAVRTEAEAHLPWQTIISGRALKWDCAIWMESKPRCRARWQYNLSPGGRVQNGSVPCSHGIPNSRWTSLRVKARRLRPTLTKMPAPLTR